MLHQHLPHRCMGFWEDTAETGRAQELQRWAAGRAVCDDTAVTQSAREVLALHMSPRQMTLHVQGLRSPCPESSPQVHAAASSASLWSALTSHFLKPAKFSRPSLLNRNPPLHTLTLSASFFSKLPPPHRMSLSLLMITYKPHESSILICSAHCSIPEA